MTPLLVTSLASDAAVGCVSVGNFTMAPASTLRHPPMFCVAVGVCSAMIYDIDIIFRNSREYEIRE